MTENLGTGSAHQCSLLDAAHRPTRAELLLLVALLLFGLSVRFYAETGFITLAASVALFLSLRRSQAEVTQSPSVDSLLLLIALVFGALGALWQYLSFFGPTRVTLETAPGLVWMLLAVIAYMTRNRQTLARYLGIALAVFGVTTAVGISHLSVSGVPDIDVYQIHVQAADAIERGENPYTDAVQVISTSREAGAGEIIHGYGYPPVTAVAYAAGEWIVGDPRAISLISWLVLLGVLGWKAARARDNRTLSVMLVLASLPAWPFVLRAAWTEPLSLLFLGLFAIAWPRSARSGLAGGLAFASKQYFVVIAPLFLLYTGKADVRRWVTAIAVVAVTVGTALALGASDYWSSTVGLYASTAPRVDSSNLIGLLALFGVVWDPPFWLPLGLGLIAAAFFGRGSQGAVGFLRVTAIALSATFLVSEQAFANYWFLVFGLCVLSLCHPTGTNVHDPKTAGDSLPSRR